MFVGGPGAVEAGIEAVGEAGVDGVGPFVVVLGDEQDASTVAARAAVRAEIGKGRRGARRTVTTLSVGRMRRLSDPCPFRGGRSVTSRPATSLVLDAPSTADGRTPGGS
jgi:hypothetical protein